MLLLALSRLKGARSCELIWGARTTSASSANSADSGSAELFRWVVDQISIIRPSDGAFGRHAPIRMLVLIRKPDDLKNLVGLHVAPEPAFSIQLGQYGVDASLRRVVLASSFRWYYPLRLATAGSKEFVESGASLFQKFAAFIVLLSDPPEELRIYGTEWI
jgi:hypothetical protein